MSLHIVFVLLCILTCIISLDFLVHDLFNRLVGRSMEHFDIVQVLTIRMLRHVNKGVDPLPSADHRALLASMRNYDWSSFRNTQVAPLFIFRWQMHHRQPRPMYAIDSATDYRTDQTHFTTDP